MSVYTQLSDQDIIALLADYDLGQYRSHQGISAGVENTNYFVNTDEHALVLTLFEKHDVSELPFFLELGEHLHNDHCKVPQPFRNKQGNLLQTVKNKPAVLIERLRGQHVEVCRDYALDIARALAQVHLSTQQFTQSRAHSHDARWVLREAHTLLPQLPAHDQTTLREAVAVVEQLPTDLPSGIIHADLFHDNALFDQGHISGIIDWYFAGLDSYALDIAITLNDWCVLQNQYDPQLGEAFIEAYNSVRQLSHNERHAISGLQVQAATRFWISRWLAQQQHQQSDDHITVKDPEQMKSLLNQLLNYTN